MCKSEGFRLDRAVIPNQQGKAPLLYSSFSSFSSFLNLAMVQTKGNRDHVFNSHFGPVDAYTLTATSAVVTRSSSSPPPILCLSSASWQPPNHWHASSGFYYTSARYCFASSPNEVNNVDTQEADCIYRRTHYNMDINEPGFYPNNPVWCKRHSLNVVCPSRSSCKRRPQLRFVSELCITCFPWLAIASGLYPRNPNPPDRALARSRGCQPG